MVVAEKSTTYIEFDTKLCEWGTSQGVRIPKMASRSARNVEVGTSFHARVGCDDEGDFILLRPANFKGGTLKLGLAQERGLVKKWVDDDLFDALDKDILDMFEDVD